MQALQGCKVKQLQADSVVEELSVTDKEDFLILAGQNIELSLVGTGVPAPTSEAFPGWSILVST
jgi:hypothetical protein